ncbi:MAG: collagen binding domain-containing protein, partial [Terriglobales bacterium]
ILKNWEGDYAALPPGTLSQGETVIAATDIAPQRLDAMTLWMKARQRGVSRARTDSGSPAGVGVFHAVEMSRVLDYTRLARARLVNQVIPVVQSDMVSYSSYDSSIIMNVPDAAATRAAMNEALNAIKSLAPDPLNLGDKRIFISEYGLFENEHTLAETTWRTQTILETSQAASILGAFMWQVFDNECYKDYPLHKTQPFPVDCSPGDPVRPLNTQCRGLWVVKPDENAGAVLPLVAPWFRPSTSGVTLTGRVTSTPGGGGVANATIAFYGGQATADANGNYSLTNVPPSVSGATVQFTASAPGYQGASQSVMVSAGQNNPTINFALRPGTDPGSVSGKVSSAIDGTALSGVSISYDGHSVSSDASGNFAFDTVPGGTYNFSAQRTGWVPETIAVNIEPGIAARLNLRLATGGQLNGQVNNNTGAGVAGASVKAHGGLAPTNITVVTNASGAFNFGWLPVGDYYLVVTADGFVQDDPQNATATLTVGATTSKTLTLSPKSDFSLTVTPSTKTITGGNPATFTVQLNPLSGFNSPVTLSVSGLPANATASFNPATISSGTSTLTVTTALTTPAGNYTLTISGTGTGLQHSTQATLTVNAAPGTATG